MSSAGAARSHVRSFGPGWRRLHLVVGRGSEALSRPAQIRGLPQAPERVGAARRASPGLHVEERRLPFAHFPPRSCSVVVRPVSPKRFSRRARGQPPACPAPGDQLGQWVAPTTRNEEAGLCGPARFFNRRLCRKSTVCSLQTTQKLCCSQYGLQCLWTSARSLSCRSVPPSHRRISR